MFCSFLNSVIQQGAVEYQVRFHATWSELTHPDDFLPNPYFSGLVVTSHNGNISFLNIGDVASLGIKNMAETGGKNPLIE